MSYGSVGTKFEIDDLLNEFRYLIFARDNPRVGAVPEEGDKSR